MCVRACAFERVCVCVCVRVCARAFVFSSIITYFDIRDLVALLSLCLHLSSIPVAVGP